MCFSMQNIVRIVSELPCFAQEGGKLPPPAPPPPLVGPTNLQILATPLLGGMWTSEYKTIVCALYLPHKIAAGACLIYGTPESKIQPTFVYSYLYSIRFHARSYEQYFHFLFIISLTHMTNSNYATSEESPLYLTD